MSGAQVIKDGVRRVLEQYIDDAPDGLEAGVQQIMELFTRPQAISPSLAPPRYRLPDERVGRTARLVIQHGAEIHKYYVTTGYYDNGVLGEVFVRKDKEGSTEGSLLDAVATAISIGLQYGIPWTVFESKFAHWRFPPNGMTEDDDVAMKMVASPLDYLVRWIAQRKTWTPDENTG